MTTLSTTQKERIERIASEHADKQSAHPKRRKQAYLSYTAALTAFAKEEQQEREADKEAMLEEIEDRESRLGGIEREHQCEGDGCPVCWHLSRPTERELNAQDKQP